MTTRSRLPSKPSFRCYRRAWLLPAASRRHGIAMSAAVPVVTLVVIAFGMLLEMIVVVIVRRDVAHTGRHRHGRRGILVMLGRRHAGTEACLQEPGRDVLRIVADQEATAHQVVDRVNHLLAVLRIGVIALLDRGTRIARGDARGLGGGERDELP